jgi:hypothetical protein
MKREIILTAILALPILAAAGDVRVSLPGSGALVLPAPEGWRSLEQPGPVRTVAFTPANGNAFEVLVSPLVRPGAPVPQSDFTSLRRMVQSAANNALSQSVEKSLPLQDLRSASVEGSYFSATDRAPKPGEFKYMTQGAVAVQGLPVSFTILSNGDPKLAVEPALQMLRSARKE